MPPAAEPLEQALIDRCVTASTPAELVGFFPAEPIAAKLKIFDWMTVQPEGGIVCLCATLP